MPLALGIAMTLLALLAFLIPSSLCAEIHGVTGGLVICVGADALESVPRGWTAQGYIFQCLETSAGLPG